MGDTSVLCGVMAEIAEPDLLTPGQGYIGTHCTVLDDRDLTGRFRLAVPNVDLPAMCSSKYRPGPPSDEAQSVSCRLRSIMWAVARTILEGTDRSDRRSGMIPLKSLCIRREKAVWTLYVDVICLNDDGSLVDAVTLAAVAALRNSKEKVVSEQAGADYSISQLVCRKPSGTKIRRLP